MSTEPPLAVTNRLEREKNIWLATIRSSTRPGRLPRPHLVPVWFAWFEQKIYVCIQAQSVKARNLASNPLLSLSLEDGIKPVICEGRAREIPKPGDRALQVIFKEKYDWDIAADDEYDLLLEITPHKWLTW